MPNSLTFRSRLKSLAACAVLAAALLLAAASAAPTSADAATKPDFRVAVPSRGDVTVAVVKLRGPKLPAKRKQTRKPAKDRGQRRRGGPRLRVLSGGANQVAVLGGVTSERVGNRRVYTALVTVGRPKSSGRRASAAFIPVLVGLAIDSFTKARERERAAKAAAEAKAQVDALLRSQALEREKAKQLAEQQKKIMEARESEEEAKRRKAEETMLQILEAIRRAQQQQQELERDKRNKQQAIELQRQLDKLQEMLRRQAEINEKLDKARSLELEAVKKEQAKNAIEKPTEMKKVLEQTPSKVIKKLEDVGGGKNLDPSALKKVLTEAKQPPPTMDPSTIAEHIKQSMERLRQCLTGSKQLCSQQQQQKPKQPDKQQQTPIVQPPAPLPPPLPPAPPAPQLDVRINHSNHPDYGWTYCVHVSTDPPQPGAQGVYGSRELGADGGSGGTFVLDAEGKATIDFERFDPAESEQGFWTMVALEWPGYGSVSQVREGPGFGPLVGLDGCAPGWID